MEIVVDRRALLAAELLDDDMVNGYADGKYCFSFDPPMSLNGVPSRYNQYARGYQRAIQQNATSVEAEFAARTGRGLCCECVRSYANHFWGKVSAQNRGWFFTKDGKAYCPEHVPGWVEEWRARNREVMRHGRS